MQQTALKVSEGFSELCSHVVKFKQLTSMRMPAAPMTCGIYADVSCIQCKKSACMHACCAFCFPLYSCEQEGECTDGMQTHCIGGQNHLGSLVPLTALTLLISSRCSYMGQ